MLLNARQTFINAAAGKDVSRANLNYPWIERTEKGPRMVATDGHILVAFPVGPLEAGDTAKLPFRVDPDALVAVRQACGKGRSEQPCNVVLLSDVGFTLPNGAHFADPLPDFNGVPDVQQVIPTPNREGSITFRLDPKLLIALIKALGAEKDAWIEINVPAPKESFKGSGKSYVCEALTVIPKDADPGTVGLIMPVAQ